MSLVKFSNRHVHRGKRVHWGRAEQDGLPYRGAFAPMYTQEEFEERVVRVGDPHAETYDLSQPDQKVEYLGVMDGIVNGWFQCLFVERWHDAVNPFGWVRIEWIEYFLEDGHPTPFLQPGMMELAHGHQTNGFPVPLLPPP